MVPPPPTPSSGSRKRWSASRRPRRVSRTRSGEGRVWLPALPAPPFHSVRDNVRSPLRPLGRLLISLGATCRETRLREDLQDIEEEARSEHEAAAARARWERDAWEKKVPRALPRLPPAALGPPPAHRKQLSQSDHGAAGSGLNRKLSSWSLETIDLKSGGALRPAEAHGERRKGCGPADFRRGCRRRRGGCGGREACQRGRGIRKAGRAHVQDAGSECESFTRANYLDKILPRQESSQ